MDTNVLRAVANASAANATLYVTRDEGAPLIEAGYIEVDVNAVDPSDGNKRGAKITDKGVAFLNNQNGGGNAPAATKPMSQYAVQTGGIELPKIKRGFQKGSGGGGAPSKYPFDEMPVGGYFFVADTAVKNGNAVKTLGSAAGSANQRFAAPTGEKEMVKRAKRGSDHKAVKGPDGKNVMETVEVEKKKFERKYVVRPVEANKAYGSFTAPANGAVCVREA